MTTITETATIELFHCFTEHEIDDIETAMATTAHSKELQRSEFRALAEAYGIGQQAALLGESVGIVEFLLLLHKATSRLEVMGTEDGEGQRKLVLRPETPGDAGSERAETKKRRSSVTKFIDRVRSKSRRGKAIQGGEGDGKANDDELFSRTAVVASFGLEKRTGWLTMPQGAVLIAEPRTVDDGALLTVTFLDGSALQFPVTEHSKCHHIMSRIRDILKVGHDGEFSLFLWKDGIRESEVLDDAEVYTLMLAQKAGEIDIVYARRVYVAWAPSKSAAKEGGLGSHRLLYAEARYRFIQSQYPATLGDAVHLGALCMRADGTRQAARRNAHNSLEWYIPRALLMHSMGDSKRMIQLEARLLREYSEIEDLSAFEAQEHFLAHCEAAFGSVYGDCFFEAMVRFAVDDSASGTAADDDYDDKIESPEGDALQVRIGIGAEGIDMFSKDTGENLHIAFLSATRWRALPSVFVLWYEREDVDAVVFIHSRQSFEIERCLLAHIEEHMVKRDAPERTLSREARVIDKKTIDEVFDKFDFDGSESLEINEVRSLLATFGVALEDDALAHVFREMKGVGESVKKDAFDSWLLGGGLTALLSHLPSVKSRRTLSAKSMVEDHAIQSGQERGEEEENVEEKLDTVVDEKLNEEVEEVVVEEEEENQEVEEVVVEEEVVEVVE
eukprot:g2047.t1